MKIGLLVALAVLGAYWLAPAPERTSPLVGEVAPPVVLRDLAGREVTLASYRGRAVAVNFWATWCPPCKEELPGFAQAWKESRGRCVDFLGVTEESTPEDTRSEVLRMEVPYPVVMDPDGNVARAYGVTGYPRTYLLDAEGRIRKVFTGMVSRDRLEAALAPLVPATCGGAG